MVLTRFLAATAICTLLIITQAWANDVQDINQQFRKGDLTGALDNANRYLVKNPKDAQVRFLKGLILAGQDKTDDAIAVFTGLTEDYPELPEPYNNLAVLYASQNKFAAAKNALEMAIRAHPDYATAHENLGDIYLKMAAIAYDKALTLDSKNTTARSKLARLQEMMPGPPARPAAVKPMPAASSPVVAKPAGPPADPTNTAIEAAIARWAHAWSARNADAYLAAYASDFTAHGMSRRNWEAERRASIKGSGHIDVKLGDMTIDRQGDTAMVTFRQIYRSDRLESEVTKTLKLALQNGQWRIVGETSK
jgi:tetratricopeptide (TPR) repeat protein